MKSALLEQPSKMIYNVYQRGGNMKVTISKWGNSLGFRIPVSVVNSMSLKNGDSVDYEVEGNKLVIKKEQTTAEMFREFYGKSIDELTAEDLGSGNELDWGEDVGGEIY